MRRRASVFVVGIGVAVSPIPKTSNRTAISSEPLSASVTQLTDDLLAGRRRLELAHTKYGSHHP